MRILLCLLSHQHVPNLLSVHYFEPDRLVLVETEGMRQLKKADHFLSALKAGGRDYADRCKCQELEHEDSLPEIRQALQAAYNRHPLAEWIVNVTGGTKPMALGTFQFFSELNITPVYINEREPNKIQWMDGTKIEECPYRP